jgi:hypothetical protein
MKSPKKFLWASSHLPTTEQVLDLESRGELEYLSLVNEDLQQSLSNIQQDENLQTLVKNAITTCREHKITTLIQPAGSPAFLFALGLEFGYSEGVYGGIPCEVLFSYSERVSVDTVLEDGSISKTSIFKHLGWV